MERETCARVDATEPSRSKRRSSLHCLTDAGLEVIGPAVSVAKAHSGRLRRREAPPGQMFDFEGTLIDCARGPELSNQAGVRPHGARYLAPKTAGTANMIYAQMAGGRGRLCAMGVVASQRWKWISLSASGLHVM
jgi:hypothetical protein